MKKILVIEDDLFFRVCLKGVLSDEGWTPIFADNPEEVAKYLPEVELVISDYDAPAIARFEETRAACQKLGKPLILQTGGVDADNYPLRLSKPYAPKALREMIRSVSKSSEG